MPTLKEQFWDPIAGFGVTFRTMFKKVVTEQYPFEKKPTAPRFHGRHQLNRWPDGLEKCIGCELCAWACPADAIYVQGMDNDPEHPTSAGERAARVYQINYLRCIMCGLCVEACPTRALTWPVTRTPAPWRARSNTAERRGKSRKLASALSAVRTASGASISTCRPVSGISSTFTGTLHGFWVLSIDSVF